MIGHEQASRHLRAGNGTLAVEELENFLLELVNNVTQRNFWCCVLIQRKVGDTLLDMYHQRQSRTTAASTASDLSRIAKCYDGAIDIGKEYFGDDHPETIRCEMARITLRLEQTGDSVSVSGSDSDSNCVNDLQKLLNRAKSVHGEYAAVVVSLYCAQGHAARRQGANDQALLAFASAHSAFRARGGADGDYDVKDAKDDSGASVHAVATEIMTSLPLLADIRMERGQKAQVRNAPLVVERLHKFFIFFPLCNSFTHFVPIECAIILCRHSLCTTTCWKFKNKFWVQAHPAALKLWCKLVGYRCDKETLERHRNCFPMR